MKQGKNMRVLAEELKSQHNEKRDFIVNTHNLQIQTNSKGESKLAFNLKNKPITFSVSDNTHQQIAARLNIPSRYYEKMRMESPHILDQTINDSFKKLAENRMIRTLGGTARAFFDVAEKLGIEVTYKPLRSNYYGLYNSISDNITLCSDSAITYYHELAHALDNSLNPDFYKLGKERKEIVAEFAGIILCQLSGISGYEDQSYKYIREYCKNNKTAAAILKSIMGVLADVEKIVEEVLSVSNDFERVDNDAEDSNLIFGT